MPKCPYCKNEFLLEQAKWSYQKVKARDTGLMFRVYTITVSCPSCDVLLGIRIQR